MVCFSEITDYVIYIVQALFIRVGALETRTSVANPDAIYGIKMVGWTADYLCRSSIICPIT